MSKYFIDAIHFAGVTETVNYLGFDSIPDAIIAAALIISSAILIHAAITAIFS